MQPSRLTLAIIMMHISTALRALYGLGLIIFTLFLFFGGAMPDIMEYGYNADPEGNTIGLIFLGIVFFIGLFEIGWSAFNEFVIYNLKLHKRWAWITAIVLAILNICSIFFILGIVALVGLLSKEVIPLFEKSSSKN